MKITSLMTQPVIEIDEDSSILEAAKKMSESEVGSLIVIRHGEGTVGIITEKDIITKVVAKEGDLKSIKVKSVMSTPLVTIEKDIDGKEALLEMAKHKVNILPIVDKGQIIGIFSTADIIKFEYAFVKEIAETAVKEFNKYRSPEIVATFLSIDDEGLKIRFAGSSCEVCGKESDYQTVVYFLQENGIETNIAKITDFEEGFIATFKIVKLLQQPLNLI